MLHCLKFVPSLKIAIYSEILVNYLISGWEKFDQTHQVYIVFNFMDMDILVLINNIYC